MSDFIKQLEFDIEKNKIIDGKSFIEKNKLVEFKHTSYNDDTWPLETIYGTVFLIKNLTILEFNSGLVYESGNIYQSAIDMVQYRFTVTPRKIFAGDINEFSDGEMNNDEMITNDAVRLKQFMSALLRNGFKMYTK